MTPVIRIYDHNSKRRINMPAIKRMALKTLDILNKRGLGELEIVFLGDRAMRALNLKHLGKDRATDVLSFNIPADEFGRAGFLGLIFISTDTCLRNSRRYDRSFGEELALYVIHGILHLFGHKDYTKKDFIKMSRKQENVLEALCTRVDLSRVLTRR